MALSGKLRKKDYQVYVIIGDGESQEGSIWEAAMAGAKWKLDNLTAVLDRNHLQNDDCVDDLMPIEPIADKWCAFGWNVVEIDGHKMEAIVEALEAAKLHKGSPTIIIAHTIKGKGVSFMENVCEWHGKAPCQEEADNAIDEIRRFSSE
jgi:transketolase